MVDVANKKRCSQHGCAQRPSYGVDGSRKVEYCVEHKRYGMVNVARKRCGQEGCATKPLYGVDGSTKPEFCAEHKRDGMVNVSNKKRCGQQGCTKRPSYGVDGSTKPEFCVEHKRHGMVNVVSKRCGQYGCTKRLSYGVDGSRKAEYLSEHKKDGMNDSNKRREPYVFPPAHTGPVLRVVLRVGAATGWNMFFLKQWTQPGHVRQHQTRSEGASLPLWPPRWKLRHGGAAEEQVNNPVHPGFLSCFWMLKTEGQPPWSGHRPRKSPR